MLDSPEIADARAMYWCVRWRGMTMADLARFASYSLQRVHRLVRIGEALHIMEHRTWH